MKWEKGVKKFENGGVEMVDVNKTNTRAKKHRNM